MKEPVDRSFEGRQAFHQATIEALDCTRHTLVLLDHDFQEWPLNTAEGERALRGALARGARARVMVARPDWLARHGDRFMRVRREYSARIEVREIPETLRIEESILLGDHQHLVRRIHHETLRGRLILASPAQLESNLPRYDALWDESTDCLPATTIGL
ncbi:MAG TPA: hypothetical protein PK359_01855 [Burkholderiaceae bacterium]|jgi:hypothetical protein|nr:hypothetical protein [Burkholderiaceae bacterium]